MAKKLSKAKAAIMLHEGTIRGKKITDRQRRYFGAIANANGGGSVDPTEKKKTGKKAVILANSMYPEFRKEYERTKDQYNKYYPGGVDFIEASGYDELKKAFGTIDPNEDLIMMAHYNPDAMYRVPVSDPNYQTLDAPKGKTIASLFTDLEKTGYQGNCYMGICHGEETARSIQNTGVNIPIYTTPEQKKWFGTNPGTKGNFEDFFFGVQGKDTGLDTYETSPISPKMGEDYLMNISPRQQELMNRRKSGTPVTEITPLTQLSMAKSGIHIKPSKKGTFTAAAKKHGKGVQAFASQVLANKENYSPAMVKKANFAHVFGGRNYEYGGDIPLYELGGGLKRSEDYGSKKKPYPSVKSSDFAGGNRSYPIPTEADAIDALRLAGLHGRSDVKEKVYKKYPQLKKGEGGLELIGEKLGGVTGIANTAGNLIQGFQLLKQERENRKKVEQFLKLSNVVNQAASLHPDIPKRKYVRPEDIVIDPNQLYPTYGTGTNYLAKNGKKIPSYQPGGWITDITGEGNEGNVGNMLGSLIGGGQGQQTGAGKIGSTIGGVAGSFLGPIGGAAGSAIGGLIGGVIGGNQQKEAERKQKQALSQLQNAAFQQGTQSLQNQYSAFMEYGGKLPSYNLGGELQVYNGKAETISQNPYLPDNGETVMFKGPSHAEGGMDIKYGKTPVEVEGGEPAVKLEHGGRGQENLIIYGDMKIPSYGVSELDDPKAKGKKFKTYIKELSKVEDKQSDIVDKGIKIVNSTPLVDSFDKLKFSSGKAMIEGGNMKLKDIARKKQIAANIQNAILDTADEFGLKSEELAKGNIKKAKKGAKIKGYAQDGEDTYPGGPFAHQTDYENIPREDAFADSYQDAQGKPDWMTVLNSVLPNLRPSNQLSLDPSQLSGEMFSLATNQLEPVQAQTYQPLLESVSDISLQDQLNANQADFNALKRLTANNPAAQATLAAQKYGANSAILGEQFRLNQAQKMGTFNRNRATLNDATLKNLAILDQQYVRQAGAKSATKATAQAALSSIAEKIARNKLENRTLGVYENLYNYRFGPRGQAFNLNPLAQFNIPEAGGQLPIYDDQGNITGYRETQSVRRDRYGMKTGSTDTRTTTTKTTKRNGGIVKAIKNL